jgi:teichuronic acid biosynthesis glycosyltransferase TuaH
VRDLIFVSLENWDEIWRRNQFLCAAFARRFPENKILFVGNSMFLHKYKEHRGLFQNKELPNIWSMNVPKVVPNPVPGGRRLNEIAAIKAVKKAAGQLKMEQPLLWLNPNESAFYIDSLGEKGVVYDITDDWELAEVDPARRKWMSDLDRALCRRADLTIVCSDALYESRESQAKRLMLLYNGVEFEHYAKSIDANVQKKYAGPVFGYTGSLHSWRVDLKILEAMAQKFPTASIVLVGPNFWPDDSLKQLVERFPNIIQTGSVPYSEIPLVMAQFDVCIVPHNQDAFTESLNPIKLWEYLACGKPIVSTNVAGFRDYPQFVRLANNPEEFVALCEKALEEKVPAPDSPEFNSSVAYQRREEARGHSWESRFDDLLQRLQSEKLL